MDANASASATPEPDADSRRRSGRVVKLPAKYAPEPTNTAAPKRKRGAQDGEEVDDEDVDSDEDVSDEDDASDEEHPAPRSRKAGGRSKKPSSKKPKINGAQPLGPAQVSRIPSRPKKTVRIEAGEKGTGLFGRLTRASYPLKRLFAFNTNHFLQPMYLALETLPIVSRNNG